ncbi:MAG: acyl-CoA desaturase [Alphaproteobacteria bacterium]|nr:acyl-CoA desaturase [Alphaproteobacteria bacterium]
MPSRGGWRLQAKGALVLAIWATLYGLALSLGAPWGFVLAAAAGAWAYTVGTCVMHECSHGTYSGRRWVNQLFYGVAAVPMGMSPTVWTQEHILRHHPNPNVNGEDLDIQQNPVLRFTPHHTWRAVYRFQHIYVFPLYGFVTITRTWIREVARLVLNRFGLKGRAFAWMAADVIGVRVAHVGLLVAAPAMAYGSLGLGLLFYLVHMYALGLIFSFAFQMTHVNARCTFPEAKAAQQKDWVLRQLETTVNWGVDRPVVTWLSGGLNMQVVHHIFQNVHHMHHPAMREIIRDFCLERGLPYHEHPGVWSSLREHLQTVRDMGRPPEPA